ncbi:T6SS protein Cts2N [Salmonella enterica subsp. enterica serovar Muenchen]|nr:T6SS protein Cts2N [Salmonella enterica subsp. enterica serovar Muenchen]ECZ7909647.1 T6SS protein Cts2N [Salmonella enterica subsp. enterica serovar Muenchen]
MAIRIYNLVRFFLLLLLCTLSLSCSFWQNRVELYVVRIDTVPNANDNTPIAVDIVAITDASLISTIKVLSAAQWFNAKPQLLRDAPGSLQVWSLELVPGSHFISNENPLYGVPAKAIVLFARYRSEGEHRLWLDKMDSLRLLLLTDEAVIAPSQGKSYEHNS